LIFWAHRRLRNLSVLIDLNGLQGFGSTREVASMEEIGARVQAFGIEAHHVDGHDVGALAAAATAHPGAVLLLHTVKGKGVSFMENRMEWHYLPLSDAQYAAALAELERS
jgi:transketolase